jgi:hypothetical protein
MFIRGLLLSLFLTANPTSLIASQNVSEERDYPVNKFDELADFYREGTLPTEAEVTGWYAGRCYYLYYGKNTALPSMFVGWFDKTTADSQGVFKGINFGRDAAPNVYDVLTPALETQINKSLSVFSKYVLAAKSDGLEYQFGYKHKKDKVTILTRKFRNITVARILQSNTYGTAGYCYWFKKLK